MDDRLLQCIGSITSGVSDCLVLQWRLSEIGLRLYKKKTDYQYLYFETGFRFQKRFPVNRKSINIPNLHLTFKMSKLSL